ncbi:zeta toxin family protein [Streptomyces sp. NPDC001492]
MTDEQRPRLLTDEELRRIFERRVRPVIDRPAQEEPRILILGGTQGSRKTTLAPLVAQQLGMNDPVIFDGDTHYAFHPRFEELAREHGAPDARKSCLADVTELRRMMKEHIRDQRSHIVLVGPWTRFEFAATEVKFFAERGYAAEAAYTAMHPARSQLGVAHRHYRAEQTGTLHHVFTTTPDFQKQAFANVPQAIEDARQHVRAVHVVDTGGVAYSTVRQTDGSWRPARDPREVVEEIRYRPWDAATRADFLSRRAAIEGVTETDWPERLRVIDELAAPMLEGHGPSAGMDGQDALRVARLAFPGGAGEATRESARSGSGSGQESSGPHRSHDSSMGR